MKTRLLTLLTAFTLAACTSLGPTETEALRRAATDAARRAPKALHLGYLQCYPLGGNSKDRCRRGIKVVSEERRNAVSWEYVLPFDHEAERQGFAAFLRDAGQTCAEVREGPLFDAEKQAYVVNCAAGRQYLMRFDAREARWGVVK